MVTVKIEPMGFEPIYTPSLTANMPFSFSATMTASSISNILASCPVTRLYASVRLD